MTVDELIEALTKLSNEGFGDKEVEIPYKKLEPTIGGSLGSKISSVYQGIDWDNGRVFLHPEKIFSEFNIETSQEMSSLRSDYFILQRNISKIIDEKSIFSDAQKIQQVKELIDEIRKKMISKKSNPGSIKPHS